jgi:hypothetical protein
MPGIIPVFEPFTEMIKKYGNTGGFISASEADSLKINHSMFV